MENEKEIKDAVIEQLTDYKCQISNASTYDVVIEDRLYHISMPVRDVIEKIGKMVTEIKRLPEPTTEEEHAGLIKKTRRMQERAASYLLLGRLSYIPFLHLLHSWWLRKFKTTKFVAGIITCGATNDEEKNFLIASLALNSLNEFQKTLVGQDQKLSKASSKRQLQMKK